MVLYHNSKLKRPSRSMSMYVLHSYQNPDKLIKKRHVHCYCSYSYQCCFFSETALCILKHKYAAYQSMTPEDSESLMMAPRSVNAADENPVHVRGQPPKKTKASWPNTGIHMAMIMEPMTPARPSWNLTVMSQERARWRARLSMAR